MRKLIFLTILSSLFFTNSFAYQFALNSKDKNLINPDYAIGKFQSKQTYYKI